MDNPTNSGQQPENNLPTPPVVEDKKLKLKWVSVGVLAMLILVGVIVFAWFEFQKKGSDKNINQISSQPNQTQPIVPTPTPFPIDSNAWEMSVAKDEVKVSPNLVENNLIYAVKKRI